MPDVGAPPGDLGDELRRALRAAGFERLAAGPTPVVPDELVSCPVLAWAGSGAMALTGFPGRPPRWPAGTVVGRLGAALSLVERAGGTPSGLDAGAVLTGRAGARGLARKGTVSAGGRCRLLPTADGWVAVSLARPGDAASVPALVEGHLPPGRGIDPWIPLAAYAARRPAEVTVERARLLGVPAAVLPPRTGTDAPSCEAEGVPWHVARLGRPDGGVAHREAHLRGPSPTPGRPVVVDLSALWAGPLCAWLLGLTGATVVKVEDTRRPDAARWGDRWLFGQLHAGHRSVALDLGRAGGRAALRAVVEVADVVIEGSRPRALASLGLTPEAFLENRSGRTWVSITGYGRRGPGGDRVAFGDDAAVGGGLVARSPGEPPVFCADAAADPLAGVYAAVAVLASRADGGGHLVDCAMAAAAAFANRPRSCPGRHVVSRSGGRWVVRHEDDLQAAVAPPRTGPLAPGRPPAPVAPLGADTAWALSRLVPGSRTSLPDDDSRPGRARQA